jgi:SAM-dependent methyltransferase
MVPPMRRRASRRCSPHMLFFAAIAHIMAPMQDNHWQLRLVGKSLKKKEKIRLLARHLLISPSDLVLDLGCAQGILSFFLRQRGGSWISVDQDFINLKTSQQLLDKNLMQVAEGRLPFLDDSLDRVVSLDYLEHLEDDQFCLSEIVRVLKPGGTLVLATPRRGFLFLLHKFRPLLGMKLEFYGHKREGYTLKDLRRKLQRAGLTTLKHRTFSGFITEFLELMLNVLYIRIYGPGQDSATLRDGHIRPSTGEEFASRKTAFRLYSLVYPLLWLISRIDLLFFWQRGYGLILWARKAQPPSGD